MLQEPGIDLITKNAKGKTALQFARDSDMQNVVGLIEEYAKKYPSTKEKSLEQIIEENLQQLAQLSGNKAASLTKKITEQIAEYIKKNKVINEDFGFTLALLAINAHSVPIIKFLLESKQTSIQMHIKEVNLFCMLQ